MGYSIISYKEITSAPTGSCRVGYTRPDLSKIVTAVFIFIGTIGNFEPDSRSDMSGVGSRDLLLFVCNTRYAFVIYSYTSIFFINLFLDLSLILSKKKH